MFAPITTADQVLRRARWTMRPDSLRLETLLPLLACIALYSGLYGAAMGLYRGMGALGQWELQMLYSAIKAPILLMGSFVVSLPSFYVLSTLLGLRDDFAAAVRALVAAQAGLAITLASLAPLTILFYASSTNYQQALVFNGLMFAVASLAGQWLLRSHFRPLIGRNPRHRQLLVAWAVAYMFVAVQLAWLLRPFIGSHSAEVRFLRPEAWDNAYVVVVRLVWSVLFGGG